MLNVHDLNVNQIDSAFSQSYIAFELDDQTCYKHLAIIANTSSRPNLPGATFSWTPSPRSEVLPGVVS